MVEASRVAMLEAAEEQRSRAPQLEYWRAAEAASRARAASSVSQEEQQRLERLEAAAVEEPHALAGHLDYRAVHRRAHRQDYADHG